MLKIAKVIPRENAPGAMLGLYIFDRASTSTTTKLRPWHDDSRFAMLWRKGIMIMISVFVIILAFVQWSLEKAILLNAFCNNNRRLISVWYDIT